MGIMLGVCVNYLFRYTRIVKGSGAVLYHRLLSCHEIRELTTKNVTLLFTLLTLLAGVFIHQIKVITTLPVFCPVSTYL